MSNSEVGLAPTFCFQTMYKQNKRLVDLVEPVITGMGYQLLGIEQAMQGSRHALLRLYIDKAGGITLDDCERVSHQVNGVMDVEDPVQGAYMLEVSSPGLDRPLFTLQQFEQHRGQTVRLNLGVKQDGRRRLTGTVTAIGPDYVIINEEGTEYNIPAASIDHARLVPDAENFNLAKRKRENE